MAWEARSAEDHTYTTQKVQTGADLQATTFPPDLQDPSINNAAALSLPKLIRAILFLKKGEPITQEQGHLDLLLMPSVTLKAQLFNYCFYSQANPSTSKPHWTPAKTRSPFHFPNEMKETFSRSCRNKAVVSIRSLYLCKDNSLRTRAGSSLKRSSFAPSAGHSLGSLFLLWTAPPTFCPLFPKLLRECIGKYC